MSTFAIWHRTTYRYGQKVSLGPHHLQLRPRESRDIRLVSAEITVTPNNPLTWATDVFGNAIATVYFPLMTDLLIVESHVTLDHHSVSWPLFNIAISAMSYPFSYSDEERQDLGALLAPQYPDDDGRLLSWAKGFIRSSPTDTLSLLQDMNNAVSAWIFYQSRDEQGTQTPLATLERGWGSCRDIALLLVEAVRRLGLGARIVSGYLINRSPVSGPSIGSQGAGSTHAWAEIYLPGAGWITFDPTNRTVGDFSLIPVTVARDVRLISPISGSFIGASNDFLGMTVDVTVKSIG